MKVGAILAHKTIRVGSYRKMLGGRTPGGGGWESHKVPAIGHVSLPRTRPERELISCFGRRLKQGTRARIRYTVTASRVRYCGGTCHRRPRPAPIGRIGAVEHAASVHTKQHRDGAVRMLEQTRFGPASILVVVADPNPTVLAERFAAVAADKNAVPRVHIPALGKVVLERQDDFAFAGHEVVAYGGCFGEVAPESGSPCSGSHESSLVAYQLVQ